jgi:hypothetical protein
LLLSQVEELGALGLSFGEMLAAHARSSRNSSYS